MAANGDLSYGSYRDIILFTTHYLNIYPESVFIEMKNLHSSEMYSSKLRKFSFVSADISLSFDIV